MISIHDRQEKSSYPLADKCLIGKGMFIPIESVSLGIIRPHSSWSTIVECFVGDLNKCIVAVITFHK